jgi:hypothetical protein
MPFESPIRLSDLTSYAETHCPEGYAALSSIDRDTFLFETLPVKLNDGRVENIELLHVGHVNVAEQGGTGLKTRLWAHASGDSVLFFRWDVADPMAAPLIHISIISASSAIFIAPFSSVRPPAAEMGHLSTQRKNAFRYRRYLLICYVFMLFGKLEQITDLIVESNATKKANYGFTPRLQFVEICEAYLRAKNRIVSSSI